MRYIQINTEKTPNIRWSVIRASSYSEHIRVFRSGIVELIGYDQFTSSQPKENIQYGKLYG